MEKVQVHIFYSGTVQGVGFRFTVRRFASRLDLNGWVRNLSDGRVEVIVEGEEKKIQQLMADVEDYFGDYIRDKETEQQEFTNKYPNFKIVF